MVFKIFSASFSISLQLLKKSKSITHYYAVYGGPGTGIYRSWTECESQVKRFNGVEYKKFKSLAEAKDFIITRKLLMKLKENSTKRTSKNETSYDPRELDNDDDDGHDNDRIDIYTDGACSNNGLEDSKAGIGVFFGDNNPLNVSKPVKGRITNNCAEIEAVTEAARIAKQNGMNKIRINTDSQFLINCYTKWLKIWKASGWRTANKRPVANRVELEEMDKALKTLDVKFKYIRGHSGIHGNFMADMLARSALNQYQMTNSDS